VKLKAIALNCTLKPKGKSSTDAMIKVLEKAFAQVGVEVTETIRIAAYDVKPGVSSDEGEGDAWPDIRNKILAHDICILGGPVWMGEIGSVAKRLRTNGRIPVGDRQRRSNAQLWNGRRHGDRRE